MFLCGGAASCVVFVTVTCFTLPGFVRSECHCESGCSPGQMSCPGGCSPGWGNKSCEQNICNCGQCREKYRQNCSFSHKCQACKKGWDGECCARENLAFYEKRKFQDENQSSCVNQKVNSIGITVKLKRNTQVKYVQLFLPKGQQFRLTGCIVKNAENLHLCNVSEDETLVTESHKFKCSGQLRQPQFKFACPNEDRVLLCQVKVYECKEFWWGPQNGCQPCRCADGEKCDPWSGDCPGVESTTRLTSSTRHPGTTTRTEWSLAFSWGNASTPPEAPQHLGTTGISPQGTPPTKKEGGHTLITIMSATGVVVLAVVVAGGVIFLHRKRLKNNCSLMKRVGSNETSLSMSFPEVTTGVGRGDTTQLRLSDSRDFNHTSFAIGDGQEDSMYANTVQIFVPMTTPISRQNFRNHLSYMGKNNCFTLEYKALPGDQEDAVNDAKLPQNISKNRFKGIYPYDNNRVFLRPTEVDGTDYINASYIDGYKESMAYIATQGPLPETIADFWHMVWSEDCGKIVTLTNLVESPKAKCAQYWPEDKKSQTYGHYSVTCLRVNTYAHYVHRVCSLVRTGDQNHEQREIHQFHFTAWPDRSVPSAAALVLFHMHVRHTSTVCTGPLVVHGSAGVGRTGTYIALEILIREAEITNCISVFSTIKQIRRQRMKMIQNPDQYQFLHEAVAEALDSQDSTILVQDVLHGNVWEIQDKRPQLPNAVREKFLAQFQVLDCWRPMVTNDETKAAIKLENSSKNRFPNVLPVDQYRVCLWAPDESASDYINAVFLPSHLDPLGCIATQLPLENTVMDFWRMTFDWKVTTVIRFLDGPSDEQRISLLPEPGCCASHGPLTIRGEDVSPWIHGIRRQSVQVHHKEVGDIWQKVCVYLVETPDALDMTDTTTWLLMTKIMSPVTSQRKPAPMIVQCFDGASRCCLLVALAITLRSLDESGQVSAYLISRLLQNARPQAFMHFEEYEFLIRCIVDHLRGRTNDSCPDELYINHKDIQREEDPTYGNL